MPFGSAHLPRDRLEASRTQASTATRAEAFVGEALRWLPDDIIAEELEGQDNPFPTPEGATGERARVLLAEDNADMRHYLSRLLATSYEVTAAADGEEAFAAARRMRPDLILTDVMMPRTRRFWTTAKAAWRSRTRLRARDRPVGARRGRSQDRRPGEGGGRLSR